MAHFTTAGDRIVLLGDDHRELGGAAWLRLLHDIEQGKPPQVDLEAEQKLADLLRLLVFDRLLHTAHDVSDGGLAITLAEACMGRGLGAEVELPYDPVQLFSESQARAVVAVKAKDVTTVLSYAQDAGVPARDIGKVGGSKLAVKLSGGKLALGVEEMHQVWSTALPRALGM